MKLTIQSYARILDNLHDGLYLIDRDGKIIYWNKAAENISGFKAEEVIGHRCSDDILTHVDAQGKGLCFDGCPLKTTMEDGIPREGEFFMHHKHGHRIPIAMHASILTDDKEDVIGAIEIFTDISNQKANALRIKELEKLALLDNLTQLANRNYIEKELISCFEEKKRFDIPSPASE